MGEPSLQTVTVVLRDATGARDADRAALAELAGEPVTRRCATCGSTDHGRPVADGVALSLARTTGVTALARAASGPIGVDLERVSRVAAAPLDAWTHDEAAAIEAAADPDTLRAVLWTVKEAALKADGRGLRVDPSTVDVAPASIWPGGTARVRYAGAVSGTAVVHRVDADLVLAVVGGEPTVVDQRVGTASA